MIFRLACLLAILSQILVVPFFLHATGRRAIAVSFVGNPLLAAALALALLWWWRSRRRDANAETGLDPGGGRARRAD